jgi:hypothetical protein
MPFSVHNIDLADNSTPNMLDRLQGGLQLAVANAAGAFAGASVTVAVSFASQLPPTMLCSLTAANLALPAR